MKIHRGNRGRGSRSFYSKEMIIQLTQRGEAELRRAAWEEWQTRMLIGSVGYVFFQLCSSQPRAITGRHNAHIPLSRQYPRSPKHIKVHGCSFPTKYLFALDKPFKTPLDSFYFNIFLVRTR